MIGMEIDIRSMKKYALSSLAISISTLIIPLGVGIAVGIAIWNEFNDNDDAIFSHYILFIGIAIAVSFFYLFKMYRIFNISLDYSISCSLSYSCRIQIN